MCTNSFGGNQGVKQRLIRQGASGAEILISFVRSLLQIQLHSFNPSCVYYSGDRDIFSDGFLYNREGVEIEGKKHYSSGEIAATFVVIRDTYYTDIVTSYRRVESWKSEFIRARG